MKNLIAFSAVKSFYDANNDFLDIICEFVLQSIGDSHDNVVKIQEKIKSDFTLDIPLDVITSALRKLKGKMKWVSYDTDFSNIKLSQEGKKERINISRKIDEAKRENNALLSDLGNFIKNENGKQIQITDVEKKLNDFISSDPAGVISCAGLIISNDNKFISEDSNIIGKYIIEKEQKDPDNFRRLKSVIYGHIVFMSLQVNKLETPPKLKSFHVYLDSNIIFSLIDLHDEQYNKSAKEMVEVLKKIFIGIRVFNFTLDEVKKKLSLYINKQSQYVPDIEVDSIYYKMKSKNIKETDVLLIINDLEDQLMKMGISVDYSFNLTKLISGKEDKIKKLFSKKEEKHKSHRNRFTIEHDISAIEAVRSIRKVSSSRIEKCRAVFLTADNVLSKFNAEDYDHIQTQTVPEVIFRSQLVNFLWLKNPGIAENLVIQDLLNGYIKTKLISQNLWDIFLEELKTRVASKTYTSEDVAILISLKETRNILSNIQGSPNDYSRKIKNEILDSKLIDNFKKQNKEKDLLKKYKKEAEEILEEKEGKLGEMNKIFSNINKNIEEKCSKFWP
jgi:hypothetical protein